MSSRKWFDRTQDISDHLVGVFLGGEVRAGKVRGRWQAYLLKTGPEGGARSFRVLRLVCGPNKGCPVSTQFWWEGVGHLSETIHRLYKDGLLGQRHDMQLGYTNNDDGVHLTCSCGFEENLGFTCSPETAYETAIAHKKQEVTNGKRNSKVGRGN